MPDTFPPRPLLKCLLQPILAALLLPLWAMAALAMFVDHCSGQATYDQPFSSNRRLSFSPKTV